MHSSVIQFQTAEVDRRQPRNLRPPTLKALASRRKKNQPRSPKVNLSPKLNFLQKKLRLPRNLPQKHHLKNLLHKTKIPVVRGIFVFYVLALIFSIVVIAVSSGPILFMIDITCCA